MRATRIPRRPKKKSLREKKVGFAEKKLRLTQNNGASCGGGGIAAIDAIAAIDTIDAIATIAAIDLIDGLWGFLGVMTDFFLGSLLWVWDGGEKALWMVWSTGLLDVIWEGWC